MAKQIILASGSEIRRQLLENAGVPVDVRPVKVDESAIRAAMIADEARPRDIADQLAETKAKRASRKAPDAIVIGCDQVLAVDRQILGKPESRAAARAQLDLLNGHTHQLLSAAVIYETGQPVWRHVGGVTLHMRQASAGYLDAYVDRNWASIRHSVGAYKLEEEGVRLFHRIDGDYFNVLGLPLLDLLAYLTLRGLIPG